MSQAQAGRYVGQSVLRKENKRLLTGKGQYTDDVKLPGMLEVAFVRSSAAKARILEINTEAALEVPGVHAVLTAQDLAQLPYTFISLFTEPSQVKPQPHVVANDDVRYVGEPIALVIADTRYIAEDAANLVEVDLDFEDPVITCEQAKTGTVVHPEIGTNLSVEFASEDPSQFEVVRSKAAYVVKETMRQQRHAAVPMETRGLVANYDTREELTVWLSCQNPHQSANYIANSFQLPGHKIRVIADDVGGGFGQKVQIAREEMAVIAASVLLRKPLKWIEDRTENLTAAPHAREETIKVELAFDEGGIILGASIELEVNNGAFPAAPENGALIAQMFPGPYRMPELHFRVQSYYTNTSGRAPYRGPWMIESMARESVMDAAARQIGIDPVDLRKRNMIGAGDQPFTTASGMVYDAVTPGETLNLTLQKLDVEKFRAEQAAARKLNKFIGMGTSVYIEPTTMAFGTYSSEVAHIRIEPSGKVVAAMSTHSQGHSTSTTKAQVIADELGVDLDDVAVLEGDSSRGGFGAGAGGSRQAVAGGGAAIKASAILKNKITAIAAHVLNASPEDISIENGNVVVAGVAEMTTPVRQIAEIAYFDPDRLPPDMEPGLEAHYRYKPPPVVFSNATHACVCEVDIETGIVKILRWIATEDCGVMINPAVVEGQVAGGIVQGIGGVLFEEITYDDYGNPTSATFKDYLMPLAPAVPKIEFCSIETPSNTPGGFKGVGEGGAIVAPAALINAIHDALAPFNFKCFDLPLSPNRIVMQLEGLKN